MAAWEEAGSCSRMEDFRTTRSGKVTNALARTTPLLRPPNLTIDYKNYSTWDIYLHSVSYSLKIATC